MNAATRLEQVVDLEASRAADFAALTERCQGAWPGEVRRILAGRSDADARRLLTGVRRPFGRTSTDRRLPLAHPLDADWRFTRESAERVLKAAIAEARGGDILLIAVPTVALAAHDRGLTHRIVVGSRIGDPLDVALRAAIPGGRFVDLQAIPAAAFRAAVLDPPWYDDVAGPLVEVAREAVGGGGRVLVCAPDHLTSPSNARRLSALPDDPGALGFSTATLAERVRYATPFFELRSLEADGITGVSPRWRTGLLYVGTPASWTLQARQEFRAAGDAWREVRRGAIRIWVRERAATGDTMDVAVTRSVSRTDRARAVASVWTSGNTYVANVGPVKPEAVLSSPNDPECPPWRQRLHTAMLDEVAALERAVDFD
ncbi:hypothetical protein R1A27_14165 [Methylobacterium sp. NMS12]|uniref:hypothetical protein n=1 Tax=Methylobacterium sp. NMS12 TaxID=3079766 RepID=UPI003F884FC2